LDEWSGKQITVTFTLHQGAGDPLAYLDLDDISLGSWLTPVIEAASPNEIHDPQTNPAITITGENFIQQPAVFIDQSQVDPANVAWLDEHTLVVTLPAGMFIGKHDLKVTNPGGPAAFLPGGFRVGWALFMPIMSR
jgi:hypothetical protein